MNMLTELRLNSLGVVAEAVLPLGPGLTALTGETGAGKTMIVAGLGLLLGARADASLVRNGQDRALVQGRWEIGENTAEAVEALGGDLDDGVELVTLRQISSQGRSRATVGGVQVPVSTAAGLLTDLATIHGQSEQTRLSTPERQRELLDAFAAPAALEDYRRDFAEHRRITEELAGLEADAMNRAREIDVLRFGLEEIAAVNPGEGEDEALAAEAVRLADADDLKALAMTARVALSGSEEDLDAPSVLGLVGAVRKALETLAERDPGATDLARRITETNYLLTDLAQDVASHAADLVADPLRQEAVAAVLLLLAAACIPLMVLLPGAAYVLVLPTLTLALTALAPQRMRPVVGALAAFIMVVIFAPTVLLIHELLSLSAVWVTVFFAIVPVAPLALTLLQAGSRRTQRTTARTSSRPEAALDGAAGPTTATA